MSRPIKDSGIQPPCRYRWNSSPAEVVEETMKNRIKEHRTVKARDLVPHELNPRTHPEGQRQALAALYEEIGFSRSLLVYELPDGRLKLIDGHLRQSLTPDEEVTVEVLDVTEEEACKLLLSIDPLAQLAGYDDSAVQALRATVASDQEAVQKLWAGINQADSATTAAIRRAKKDQRPVEQYLLIITCKDEQEQVALLRSLKKEGIQCQAKIS